MRLAIVTTSYPADEGDASGHFVRAEARAMASAGHDVTVIAPLERVERAPATPGLTLVAIPGGGAFGWPGVASRLRRAPCNGLALARWVRAARRAVRDLGPFDEVAAHWCVPSAWPVGFEGSHRLTVVSHGGDVRLLLALPSPARALAVRALARRASTWRFVSAALCDELTDAVHGDARSALVAVARVEPSPLEMPPRDAEEGRVRARLAGRRPYVVVGRLTNAKRVHRAIEHVATQRSVDGEAPLLVVVGDGPARPALQALAARLGVDALFTGTVPRPEALAWLAASRALLFASQREGLPTVLREAEHLGVPVRVLD